MATFQVDRVNKETKPLSRSNLEAVIQNRIGRVKPECFSKLANTPIADGYIKNGFVSAVHIAYSSHYPMVITPDAIWMCIVQGFAKHINENAEKLRHLFVEHESKKKIVVRRDDFVKGSPANPWPEVFDEFSQQIRGHIGEKTHNLLTPDFSTTGPVERAAAQVVLMDCFKEYFAYELHTRCGIPEVTLEGTVDDWKRLRERALRLTEYDLEWWTKPLEPVLDQFVAAASGKIDQKFWSSIYKHTGGSGGPYILGWIVTLFPYIDDRRNPYLSSWNKHRHFGGMKTNNFTAGIVSTPFKWEYFDNVFPMYFYAGFMAISQDPRSLALRPEIGWAVADEKEVESAKENMKMDMRPW